MTRDGVVLENQATGEEINVADREAEQDFFALETGGTAEKVLEWADRLDAARTAIPKETVKIGEKVFDEASDRAKTHVRREKRDEPPPAMKPNPASRPVQEVLLFTHGKIHEVR